VSECKEADNRIARISSLLEKYWRITRNLSKDMSFVLFAEMLIHDFRSDVGFVGLDNDELLERWLKETVGILEAAEEDVEAI
jgi:hypothetical protein